MLVLTWCLLGVYLVVTWWSLGPYFVVTCSLFCGHLVVTRFLLGLYTVISWFSLDPCSVMAWSSICSLFVLNWFLFVQMMTFVWSLLCGYLVLCCHYLVVTALWSTWTRQIKFTWAWQTYVNSKSPVAIACRFILLEISFFMSPCACPREWLLLLPFASCHLWWLYR